MIIKPCTKIKGTQRNGIILKDRIVSGKYEINYEVLCLMTQSLKW